MNLKDLFEICSMICDKHIDRNPMACVVYEDNKILYTDIKQELNNLKDWCFPMDSKCIKKCTLCKDCKHYVAYTKSTYNHPKASVAYMCDLDNLPKKADHYCGYGEEK